MRFPEVLDSEKSLEYLLLRKPGYRSASERNSWKIAALCTPEFIAGLSSPGLLAGWIGDLDEPEAGRALMRAVLDHAESMPRQVREAFAIAPILMPKLLLAPSRYGMHSFIPWPSPSATTRWPKKLAGHLRPSDPASSADAIVNRAGAVLHGFGIGRLDHYFKFEMKHAGRASDNVRKRVPADVAALVKADSADHLRLLADIRAEPMPVALMLYDGGPKCHELLLRPETYERSDLSLDSLATFAVMCLPNTAAMPILEMLEAASPGFLQTVKDAAGHCLLWYLGFRKTIRCGDWRSRSAEEAGREARIVRDYLVKKAKCDPDEPDAFGISWTDVCEKLGLYGLRSSW